MTTATIADHAAELGRAIRIRRGLLGLSISELVRRSGLSQSFLSQVEMGQSDLSVGRLIRVAQVLDVSVTELLEAPPRPAGRMLAAGERTVLPNPSAGLRLQLLVPSVDNTLTYVHGLLEAGAVARATRENLGSQSFVYLLEGTARIDLLDGESLLLEPEDSASYRSEVFEAMANTYDGETVFVWVQAARSRREDPDR